MFRCLLPVFASILLVGAVSGQDAAAKDERAKGKSALTVRPVRVTEIRNVSMQGRKGAGVTPATEVPAGLHVRLECFGKPVSKTTDVGNFKLKGRDDKERKLALTPSDAAPAEGFVALDRRAMFAPNRPPANRIWVDLLLTLPDRGATAFSVEGTFDLQQANRTRIPIRELQPGVLQHKDLVAAELAIEVQKVGDTYVVMKVSGKPERLDEVQIFGGQRQEITRNSTIKYEPDGARVITYELSGPTEGGRMQLIVDVPSGVVTVPVRLENVPLP